MITPAAFWDTSALVPLCVYQQTSRRAHLQQRRFMTVVWWATVVEAQSAFSRLHRSGVIDAEGKRKAQQSLAALAGAWKEIAPSDAVRSLAADLLDTYVLRAADSLQLAAALVWCRERPANRPFLCADQRLATAATAAGFAVIALV